MDISQIESYAPYVLIIILFALQNNIFVRPETLEKKHREILDDIKEKYVEINAYKEFQTHIYSKFDEVIGAIDDVKEIFLKRRKND